MDKKLEELKSKLCLQCMECCKYVTFTLQISDPKTYRKAVFFYETRGFEVIQFPGSIQVVINTVCPQLTSFGCKIYLNRPAFCRDYDGRKDSFMIINKKCAWIQNSLNPKRKDG